MRKALLGIAAILTLFSPSAALSQINAPIPEIVSPKPVLPFQVIVIPELGMCVANFVPQGTANAYMVADISRGWLVLGIDDPSLGLTALKNYKVAVRRGDLRIEEDGLASIDQTNVMNRKAVGIASAITQETLQELTEGVTGDFTYSIVVKGKDIELFRLTSTEFEHAIVDTIQCNVKNRHRGVLEELADPSTTWSFPGTPTPEELGIGDGNRKVEPPVLTVQ